MTRGPLVDLGPHVVVGDIARFLVVVFGALTLSVAAVVILTYGRVYLTHRRAIRAGEESRWQGLLPRHVFLIGVSYFALVLTTVATTIQNIHGPLIPRLFIYIGSYATGLWAMWDILGHSRHRLHDLSRNR